MRQMTRRKAVASIGSIGAVGVGAYTLTGTSQAAEVSIDGLSIPDKHKRVRSEIEDIRLSVNARYSYNANVVPDKVEMSLRLGTHPDDMYAVAKWENDSVELKSNEGEQRLQGSILNTPTYDLEQFQTSESGDTASSNMLIAVELRVIANGEIQSRDYAEDTHQLTVENGEITVSGEVGGTGNMSVRTAK